MKKEMLSPVKSLLIMVLLFISVSRVFSQSVVWKEGFIPAENNENSAYWTSKGQWSLTSLGASGSLSNTWYIGISEVNTGVGNCANVPYIIDVATTLDSIKVGTFSDSTHTGGNSTASSGNVNSADSIKVTIGAGSTVGNTGATGIDTIKVVGNNVTVDDSPVLFLGLNEQNINSKYFPGAFFSTDISTETNWRIESPVINLSNKKDIKISFEYLLGVLNNQAQFIVSYYDGSSWIDLPALPNTFSGTCPEPKTSKWATSPVLSLPASVNNLENFKIAFSFVSTSAASNTINPSAKTHANKGSVTSARLPNFSPNSTGVNPQVSVAIDNITVSGSASTSANVDPNSNASRTANTNKIDIKTVADANNKATIIFTTYSEKFPANNLVIESGMDGVNFTELTQIKSKATEGKITKIEYSFTDVKAAADLKYYRVKQFNADKRVVLSPVVSFPVNSQRTANTNKIDIKTVADKKSNPNIVFTTYSEKFPANDLVIESSTDGTDFNELSKIKSKAVKGSVTKLEYSFSDANANDGVNYYRIKQVTADKTTVISKIVSIDHIKAKNITFTVYPNPNSGQFTVDFSGIENNHEVQIVLNDMNDGHEIYSTTFYSNSIDSNKMDVNPPTKIAPGRYICSLIFEGIRSSVIVMIN